MSRSAAQVPRAVQDDGFDEFGRKKKSGKKDRAQREAEALARLADGAPGAKRRRSGED